MEPIERPYCYLLLVTCYHWGWCFWAIRHVLRPYCYLLFVICYFWGWRIWVTGHVERPYCYLLFVISREHKSADPFRESIFLRRVPPIPPQPGAKRAPRQTYREP